MDYMRAAEDKPYICAHLSWLDDTFVVFECYGRINSGLFSHNRIAHYPHACAQFGRIVEIPRFVKLNFGDLLNMNCIP